MRLIDPFIFHGGKMTSQTNTAFGARISRRLTGLGFHRGYLYTFIILTALLAFESFNYSTTQFALSDLLGNLTFAGLSWATILSIAFCGIDFAGIARLFTPDRNSKGTTEVWYLFGGWILAATMNAILTWWAVSLALEDHILKSTSVLSPNLLIKAVPVFVSVMVWLIRILIIGSLSMTGDRLFSKAEQQSVRNIEDSRNYIRSQNPPRSYIPNTKTSTMNIPTSSFQPIHRASIRQEPALPHQSPIEKPSVPVYSHSDPDFMPEDAPSSRPEPVYQPILASPKHNNQVKKLL
jgi:hypothetical protein